MEKDLDTLERTLKISFQDRSRLFQALIHRSYLNENPDSHLTSNERLEFLGDAVLDFLSADYLYRRFPGKGEGELTLIRSALVRTETLASFATELNLGQHLILGKGEEADQGRTRSTILADAFEAVLGAIFLDAGLERTAAFLRPFLEGEIAQLEGRSPLDFKSALQIQVQGRRGITPRYRTVAAWGPDHSRTFRVEVLVGEHVLGQGEGPSKQAAQQEAAQTALEHLREETA